MKLLSASRPFLVELDSLGDYHAFLGTVLFRAPDDLAFASLDGPVDQTQALADAFESLKRGLVLAKSKLKDERRQRIAQELLVMAFDFYTAGEKKNGIAALQELEGLIWPSRSVRQYLVAEAERRAFGHAVLFAAVKPRRYDGEVTRDRLGPRQLSLLEAAQARTLRAIQEGHREGFKICLVCTSTGQIDEVRASSKKKLLEKIRRRVDAAEVLAVVRAELVFLDLLVLDIEEQNQALVSARSTLKNGELEGFRFFLDDPVIFPVGDA